MEREPVIWLALFWTTFCIVGIFHILLGGILGLIIGAVIAFSVGLVLFFP